MKKVVCVALLVGAVTCLYNSVGVVDSGFAGARLLFGRVTSDSLEPGLHWFSPVGGSLAIYDCRESRKDIKMNVYTKDVQSADFDVTVMYHVDPKRIPDLQNHYGQEYGNKVLVPVVTGVAKEVIGQWEADQLISGREKAKNEIFTRVQTALANTPILVTNIVLSNIDYSDVFEKAIEEKQVAMQNAIRAKNRTQEIEEEARQKLIAAEAEAKALTVRGEALRTNPELAILEAVNKWDGHAPETLVWGGKDLPLMLPLQKKGN